MKTCQHTDKERKLQHHVSNSKIVPPIKGKSGSSYSHNLAKQVGVENVLWQLLDLKVKLGQAYKYPIYMVGKDHHFWHTQNPKSSIASHNASKVHTIVLTTSTNNAYYGIDKSGTHHTFIWNSSCPNHPWIMVRRDNTNNINNDDEVILKMHEIAYRVSLCF